MISGIETLVSISRETLAICSLILAGLAFQLGGNFEWSGAIKQSSLSRPPRKLYQAMREIRCLLQPGLCRLFGKILEC